MHTRQQIKEARFLVWLFDSVQTLLNQLGTRKGVVILNQNHHNSVYTFICTFTYTYIYSYIHQCSSMFICVYKYIYVNMYMLIEYDRHLHVHTSRPVYKYQEIVVIPKSEINTDSPYQPHPFLYTYIYIYIIQPYRFT